MSQFARHARRTPKQIKRQRAWNRFRTVWADRIRRNAPSFVGGAATLVLASTIGAMLGLQIGAL